MKLYLTGAALISHLVRFWKTVQKYYRSSGVRINYMAHALLLAVQWDFRIDISSTKGQEIEMAIQLARLLHTILPEDLDLPVVIRYLEGREWEKPDEARIYDGNDLIYASTITELFHTYRLMPLRWTPAT